MNIISNISPALSHWWHPVGMSADIGAGPTRVLLLGQPWVVARLGGELTAFPDRCPHRGARLSAGAVRTAGGGGATLQCSYHGWCFDSAGRCVDVPSVEGLPPTGTRYQLERAAGVCDAYGLVWLAPEEPTAPILPFAEWGRPAFACERLPVARMSTGAAQMVENNVDTAHIPFVHQGTFGAAMKPPRPRDVSITRGEWSMEVRHSVRLGDGHWETSEVAPHIAVVGAPFSSSLRVEFPSGMVNAYYQTLQPEDLRSSVVYQFFATNRADDPGAYAEELAFNQRILQEDLAMLAQIDDPTLDLDLAGGAHVPADRVTLAYRRLLADVMTAVPAGPAPGSGAPATADAPATGGPGDDRLILS